MSFLSKNPSPFFSNRKIDKIQNEYAARMSDEESYLFLQHLSESIICKNCNERFYSKAGLRGHVC